MVVKCDRIYSHSVVIVGDESIRLYTGGKQPTNGYSFDGWIWRWEAPVEITHGHSSVNHSSVLALKMLPIHQGETYKFYVIY